MLYRSFKINRAFSLTEQVHKLLIFMCDNCHEVFTSKKSLIKHLETSETCIPKFSTSNISKNVEKDVNLEISKNIKNENCVEDMNCSTNQISTKIQLVTNIKLRLSKL